MPRPSRVIRDRELVLADRLLEVLRDMRQRPADEDRVLSLNHASGNRRVLLFVFERLGDFLPGAMHNDLRRLLMGFRVKEWGEWQPPS